MAILVIFTGDLTKDEYERLSNEIDWKRNWAPGAMMHVAAFDDAGGIHVADVWESAEKMNAFVEQRLMPAFQKLGFNPPNVEVYQAHNIDTHSSMSQYQRA